MHRVDLSELVIAVDGDLVARANVALKGRRPGERAAEYPAWIGDCLFGEVLQCAEVDRCAVSPQECRLLDQLAVIPGPTGRDAEPALDAGHQRGLNTTDPVITSVDVYAQADETGCTYGNLCVVPVLLIDRAIPLNAPVQPHRLPAQLVVGENVGCEGQGRFPAPVHVGLCLIVPGSRAQRRAWTVVRSPTKAASAETLRPGVVQQRIVGDFPAEVRAALEAGKSPVEVFCI